LEIVGKIIKGLFVAAFLSVYTPSLTKDTGQSLTYQLHWESPSQISTLEGSEIKTMHFQNAIHVSEFSYMPIFPLTINKGIDQDIVLEVLVSEPLTDQEFELVYTDSIEKKPLIKWIHGHDKGKSITRAWIFPFYTDEITGQIHKLISFSINYSPKPANNHPVSAYRIADAGTSVLSDGEWYKIGVTERGIHMINADFLRNIGIDPTGINPKNIRIYGNGAYVLPQENHIDRPSDLLENSIYVSGEEDSKFDENDFILFFGQSPHKLEFQNINDEYQLDYIHNIYSDTTYYFLTVSDSPGSRVGIVNDLGNSFPQIGSFDHLEYYEKDHYNILSSGREWYGELFDIKTSYEFIVPTEGLSGNTALKIVSDVMSRSYEPSSFTLEVDGYNLGNQDMDPVSEYKYATKGSVRQDLFETNTSILNENINSIKIKISYNKSGTSALSAGYLNYLNIWCKRDLAGYNTQTYFQSIESTMNTNSTFTIKEMDNSFIIWDVTDPIHPNIQEYSEGSGSSTFGFKSDTLRKYILFNNENTLLPAYIDKVNNQNLHGLNVPEFLIITHSDFLGPANRLSTHRNQRGISTEVVTINELYNEFSSGSQDVTAIRDFIKYLYDAGSGKLNSILLLGRGSYDYKDISPYNTNYIPIYESRNSLHPIYSYSSDDYYGFLDVDEGYWDESYTGDHTMDVSIGRLPVITSVEADDIINKIIVYDSDPDTYGPWRNDIYFVADDGDGTDGIRHSNDADRLATMVDTAYANFNIGKIYVDAYPQEILPNSQLAPEVNEAINDAIKSGALLLNFTGHGNEAQWTLENILNLSMVASWENLRRLPFLITATCEYGRHDDPKIRSGAEFALTNKRGGAVGLLTTARPVFASTNFILNRSFYSQVFEKEEGKYQTIGEIFRKTKNLSLNGAVNRNFSLLGDPSMKLSYPDQNIVIQKINEIPITEEVDTLKALKNVVVSGNLYDSDQNQLNSFNGILSVAVYDKVIQSKTLGTQDPVMYYDERKSLIFKGDVTVNQGAFDFEFVVSKNISYQLGEGKISMYAVNDEHNMDASGSNIEILVGGTSSDYPEDNLPPEIYLYLEDTTFVQGDVSSDHPRLIAEVFDENGINITENDISQGIVALLDDQNEFILNNFYTADIDSYRSGKIEYQLSDLEEGRHYLTLKVWDVYNNMAEGYLEFLVGESEQFIIKNLINYPNPFNEETTFSFEHNRSGEDLDIDIQIYSRTGSLVKVIDAITVNSEFRINDIKWDGRGESGKKLESGLYIYRVIVRSLLDGAKKEDFKKLVIIN